jgi:hypothetical protein
VRHITFVFYSEYKKNLSSFLLLNWKTEGDKNTKYFLNLEKYKQETNSVKELFNKNGEVVNDTDSILDIE